MGSMDIWIAPLIERCLVGYGKGLSDPDLHWQDDGSNLRFSSSSSCLALINSWTDEGTLTVANLTDSQTQIDAKLTRESLEEYKRSVPDRALTRAGCRGYYIQLAEFELVFEHSTSQAKVHLYVRRFEILWDRGKLKTPPQGKQVRRNSSLYNLMKAVLDQIKSRERHAEKLANAALDISLQVGDCFATQAAHGHQHQLSQAPSMTQLPAYSYPAVTITAPDPERDILPSKRLLEHLGPQPKSLENGQLPSLSGSTDEQPLNGQLASTASTGYHPPASQLTSRNLSSLHLLGVQGQKPAAEAVVVPLGEIINPRATKAQASADQLSSPKNDKESSATTNVVQYSPPKPNRNPKSLSPLDRYSASPPGVSQGVTLLPRNSANKPSLNTVDPWEGMTEIRSCDVTIEKDQFELMDGLERIRWFPPRPGEDAVPGYVPPSLLSEWNRIALRRTLKRKEAQPTSIERGRLSTDGPMPSPNIVESQSQPDSDEEVTDWSNSDYESSPAPRQRLPDDSSPVRERLRIGEVGQQRVASGDHEDQQASHTAISQLPDDDQNKDQGLSSAPQSASPEKPLFDNHIPSKQSEPNNMTHSDDCGHESDNSSEESVMDISIPHPLTGNSQHEFFIQVEGAPSSSALIPPNSSTGQEVQVSETPAALLNRPISSQTSGIGPDSESRRLTKSSSQSRILNTYASNEGDKRGAPSQESSKSFLTSDIDDLNHQVHVARTPVSSSALPTQDVTPWSRPGVVWNSSWPKSSESSAPKATSTYQSQSSNAFSSYRELPPSSMLSVKDQGSPSMPSSTHGSPTELSRVLRLKRFASEVEMDDEVSSPCKRNKTDHLLDEGVSGKQFDQGVIARRSKYISNSTQSFEASRVYEKFRNDYPNYFGDLAHFTELCYKLQAFRNNGGLQRSFLWDDFVIRHIEYPRYLVECHGTETKPLDYAEYFASSFSKPSYKKRSLTADGVNICAAQYTLINESATTTTSPAQPATDTRTSFTSSLRDQFSNFHAHSFEPPAQETTHSEDIQYDTDTDHGQSHSQSQSQNQSQNQGPNEDQDQVPSEYSIPDSEPARLAAQEKEAINDAEMTDIHETASVELGGDDDDRPPKITIESPAPDVDVESSDAESSDAESLNENWFLSLRHMRPTSPVWSDSPDTPFKKWARADQNVLVERYQRGGVPVAVDEKGVIKCPFLGMP